MSMTGVVPVDREAVSSGPTRRFQGFSLIEMLIALLVLSIGLLGMAGLQAYSLRNNTSAYQRSQANTLVYDILDSMRSNRAAALQGNYNVGYTVDPSGSDQFAQDLYNWKQRLSLLLPSGTGEVTCNSTTGLCRVTVIWDDGRLLGNGSCRATPASCQQLTVSTRL